MFPFLKLIANGLSDQDEFQNGTESGNRDGGIGAGFSVTVNKSEEIFGTWYVSSVSKNSTAFEAGLLEGDIILQVIILFR